MLGPMYGETRGAPLYDILATILAQALPDVSVPHLTFKLHMTRVNVIRFEISISEIDFGGGDECRFSIMLLSFL